MASIHKQPGRPFWFASYRAPDGKQHFQSTKTKNKAEAEAMADAWEQATRTARAGRLTPDKAREVLAAGLERIFLAANAEALPASSVRVWCQQWLEAKKIETAPTTVARYEGILQRFFDYLGACANKDVVTLTAQDVTRFRDKLARELSNSSANLAVKTLRVCFGTAHRQGLVTNNVAAMVDKLRVPAESRRRPFTVAEIERLLAAAGDSEWRGLILVGAYCGARLGDCARLRWNNVDLQRKELAFVVGKTGKRQVLPMAKPLADYFEALPSSDDPTAFVFPKSAEAAKRTGTLSNWFYDVMVDAGLAKLREKKTTTGKGRNASRPVGEISFHCLRHSLVTFLKAAGVSDALAQGIAGHQSAAMSKIYTHLSADDLRGAVNKLPDVTATPRKPAQNAGK